MKNNLLICAFLFIAVGFTYAKVKKVMPYNHSKFSRQFYFSKIAQIDKEIEEALTMEQIHKEVNRIEKYMIFNIEDTIPKLKWTDEQFIRLLCGDIVTKSKVSSTESEYYEYTYEKRIWEWARVIARVDNEETVKKKIQEWWNKYKIKCKCDTNTFNVPNGNILKFAISEGQLDFIEVLVLNYDLDINFIDPADHKNLLDYINDEIIKMKTDGSSKSSIEIYDKYKAELISIGAKPSK